ncbi:MAG TPA: ROK family protein [Acetobacteraceae bacterium]|nr:ROK family protein [Acetobacteraceae bacterium]
MNDRQDQPSGDKPLTLAIDVGGSHLKAGIVDESGVLVPGPAGLRDRVETPKGAPPPNIVAALVGLAKPLGHFDRISIGFPGVVRGGIVLTAPNLGNEAWHGFPLAKAIAEALGKPARMLNDASVQGLGAIGGQGIELVLTLGTGMGFALFDDGRLAPHLEMSQHPARKKMTYDEYIGDAARREIGPRHWSKRVHRVIGVMKKVVGYDCLYLGGGNARHVAAPLPPDVHTVSNEAGVTGGVRLWDRRLDAMFGGPAPAFLCASSLLRDRG